MESAYTDFRSLFVLVMALLACALGSAAQAAPRVPGFLVDTAWLAAQQGDAGIAILDVRDDPANFDRQLSDKEKADPKAPIVGHIRGAHLLDWKLVRETREIDGVKLDKMVLTTEAMLGAILQRQIMDHVEAGMALENAVSEVAEWHRQSVSASPVLPSH